MCTLSWIRQLDGYHVCFNRDERRTRAAGLPPEPGERGGVKWLAPRDGESHGTWIGVNRHGVSLAILNRWHESPVANDGSWTSRGIDVSPGQVVMTYIPGAPRGTDRIVATLDR